MRHGGLRSCGFRLILVTCGKTGQAAEIKQLKNKNIDVTVKCQNQRETALLKGKQIKNGSGTGIRRYQSGWHIKHRNKQERTGTPIKTGL